MERSVAAQPGLNPVLIKAPVRTLTDILTEEKIDRINLLSLDVEGCEVDVLNGLDFDKFAPDWILVEANDINGLHQVLDPRYEFIGNISEKDHLYRNRKMEPLSWIL